MREQPVSVLEKLQAVVSQQHRIVISAITYQEMQFGLIGKRASAKHAELVNQFLQRVDGILAWDKDAVDCTVKIKQDLQQKGTPIGGNDTAIAGHAISQKCVLVTNNTREFSRVTKLKYEDWVH